MTDEVVKIYIQLLNEGVATARPAPAKQISDQTYKILLPDDYDPEDEEWEFLPGDIVLCEQTKWNEKGSINLGSVDIH